MKRKIFLFGTSGLAPPFVICDLSHHAVGSSAWSGEESRGADRLPTVPGGPQVKTGSDAGVGPYQAGSSFPRTSDSPLLEYVTVLGESVSSTKAATSLPTMPNVSLRSLSLVCDGVGHLREPRTKYHCF